MQRLLNHARWDADAVRDALWAQVAERFRDLAGVLVGDAIGFEKQGRRLAGVQRQYTGTAGKITNCRIGGFCSYVNPDRQPVPIDRELHPPKSRFADPDRLADAGVPDAAGVRHQARAGVADDRTRRRRPAAGVRWVTGDEAYGDDTALSRRCSARGLNHVFAVSCDHPVQLGGHRPAPTGPSPPWRPGWQRYSASPEVTFRS
ncbi:transposase [Actinomadura geliboluensis]|uniref:transposase n=1 Tax=Actinomadura geliboluensis TaxID=882440 RepID=UPI00372020CF